MMNVEILLGDFGVEIRNPEFRSEVAFALGEQLGEAAARERLRTILADDRARSHPFTALRLALDSTLPADDVLRILADLPPERADDSLAMIDNATTEGTP